MASSRKINGKITKEYQAWKAMKSRCYSPVNKQTSYQNKQVIVCEQWKNNFDKFLEDMGKCPEGYSLDRIDNNGNYEPSNCRWSDNSTQSKNRGTFNKVFTYAGKSMVLKDWAKELNINYTTLYQRIYRSGLSFEKAIEEDPFNVFLEYNNEIKSLDEWSKITGIPKSTISDRKRRGWAVNRIFEQKVHLRN
jgi:hypothetical protein